MIDTTDIRNGLKLHLLNGGISPSSRTWPDIAWPNVNVDFGRLPRFEVMMQEVDREGGTLKGNEVHREIGFMAISICTRQGNGEDDAFDWAEDIRSLFPEATRIAITGGVIVTNRPAKIGAGYPDPDGTCYRLPVTIRYIATAT